MIKKASGGYQLVPARVRILAGLTRHLMPQRNGCGKWSFSNTAKDRYEKEHGHASSP